MKLSTLFAKKDLLIVPTIYLAFGAILYFSQDSLIYYPDKNPHGECEDLPDAQVIEEGSLRGYYIQNERDRIAIQYHGNAGTACDRELFVEPFAEQGYSILLVEYPGYANDPEPPTTRRILDMVPEVVTFVEERGYETVALVGESIGSGYASYHATLAEPDTLILISPFDSLSGRAQRTVWIYPARMLLRDDLLVDEWARVAPRVQIIAAENDRVIPRRHTDHLYRALPDYSTQYIVVPNTDHSSLYGSTEFFEAISGELAYVAGLNDVPPEEALEELMVE